MVMEPPQEASFDDEKQFGVVCGEEQADGLSRDTPP
jgi:hypothetical protein